jgi:hypothetical protein
MVLATSRCFSAWILMLARHDTLVFIYSTCKISFFFQEPDFTSYHGLGWYSRTCGNGPGLSFPQPEAAPPPFSASATQKTPSLLLSRQPRPRREGALTCARRGGRPAFHFLLGPRQNNGEISGSRAGPPSAGVRIERIGAEPDRLADAGRRWPRWCRRWPSTSWCSSATSPWARPASSPGSCTTSSTTPTR